MAAYIAWAIVPVFVLLPMGYGVFVFLKRKNPAYQPAKLSYAKGFGIGFALMVAVNALNLLTGGQRVPADAGGWIDLLVQSLMVGILFAAIGAWLRRPRKQA